VGEIKEVEGGNNVGTGLRGDGLAGVMWEGPLIVNLSGDETGLPTNPKKTKNPPPPKKKKGVVPKKKTPAKSGGGGGVMGGKVERGEP